MQDAWMQFREELTEEETDFLAQALERHDLTSHEGYILFCKDVMMGLFTGKISPEIAHAAEPWAEKLFVALTTHTGKHGSPQDATTETLKLMVEATRKLEGVKPTYVIAGEERDPALIEADE